MWDKTADKTIKDYYRGKRWLGWEQKLKMSFDHSRDISIIGWYNDIQHFLSHPYYDDCQVVTLVLDRADVLLSVNYPSTPPCERAVTRG